MKRFLLCLCCFLICTSCVKKEAVIPEDVISSSQSRMQHYISILTSSEFEGRCAEGRGEAQTSYYLARFLQQKGVIPAGQDDTYFQTFLISSYEHIFSGDRLTFRKNGTKKPQYSENVLGYIQGQSEDIVVVSAHYDHLGIYNNKLYPGANDNASGVTLIMELINSLEGQIPRYSLLIAFWGAEEKGLLGSRYYCQQPTISLDRIKGVVNFDSVGNLGQKELIAWTVEKNGICDDIIQRMEKEGWSIRWKKNLSHSSDHLSFAKSGIPGLTLLSPTWLEGNHTHNDNMSMINIEMLCELMLAVKNVLLK